MTRASTLAPSAIYTSSTALISPSTRPNICNEPSLLSLPSQVEPADTMPVVESLAGIAVIGAGGADIALRIELVELNEGGDMAGSGDDGGTGVAGSGGISSASS